MSVSFLVQCFQKEGENAFCNYRNGRVHWGPSGDQCAPVEENRRTLEPERTGTELERDSLHLGRDSLEQTRRAFLVNLANETTYYGTQLMVTKPVPDWLTAYLRAIHGAIKDVDAESAKRFEEAWRRWSGSEWSTIREMGPQILKAFETTRENPR